MKTTENTSDSQDARLYHKRREHVFFPLLNFWLTLERTTIELTFRLVWIGLLYLVLIKRFVNLGVNDRFTYDHFQTVWLLSAVSQSRWCPSWSPSSVFLFSWWWLAPSLVSFSSEEVPCHFSVVCKLSYSNSLYS